MRRCLRNILILTFIETISFVVFVFVAGRPTFFLGRTSLADVETNQHYSGQRDITNLHVSKVLPSDAEKNVTKSKAADELVTSKNASRGTRPETTKLADNRTSVKNASRGTRHETTKLADNRTSVITADSRTTLKQGPTAANTSRPRFEDMYRPINGTPKRNGVAHNYKLIIDEPKTCYDDRWKPKETFLVIFILTIHKNFEQRHTIRETWGSPKEINGKRIVTVFLLAHTEDTRLQKLVEEESKQHHDLLQEDFVDSYKNLTLKTMMGMKWVASHCPHASYFMKTDDDMYVSYANLVTYLSSPSTPKTNLAFGHLMNGGPIRNPKSKWFMPKEKYPGSKYPPFLSGTGYVMSADVAGKVYRKSLDTGFLYLEDVFVAVCFKSLKIVPIRNKDFRNWRTSYSYCAFRKLITTHMVPTTEMTRIWKDQHSQGRHVC